MHEMKSLGMFKMGSHFFSCVYYDYYYRHFFWIAYHAKVHYINVNSWIMTYIFVQLSVEIVLNELFLWRNIDFVRYCCWCCELIMNVSWILNILQYSNGSRTLEAVQKYIQNQLTTKSNEWWQWGKTRVQKSFQYSPIISIFFFVHNFLLFLIQMLNFFLTCLV